MAYFIIRIGIICAWPINTIHFEVWNQWGFKVFETKDHWLDGMENSKELISRKAIIHI